MRKKRTGLQSDISAIFSGVPVPKKKGSPPEESPAAPAKGALPQPPAPPAKPTGVEPPQPAPPPVAPKPAPVPKPKVAEPSTVVPPVKVPVAPAAPKVVQTKAREPKVRQIPTRVPKRRKDRFPGRKAGASTGRQKASIVMFVFLSVVLVLVLARPYYNSRGNPAGTQIAAPVSVGGPKVTNVEIDWPDPPVYQPFYRDPMDSGSNGSAVPQATQDIVVTGIVYSEDNPRAIIDRQYYGVGDKVKDAVIMEITRNSVAFERDGKTWTQRVQEVEK